MTNQRYFIVSLAALATLLLVVSFGYKDSRYEQLSSATQLVPQESLPLMTNKAFRAGEKLYYRLHYGFLNAGVAELEVKPDVLHINGRDVYHIVGTGYSTGTTDWFFKVRDRYETFLDKEALLPWLFVRRVDEGGYKFSQDYKFNHYTKKVDIGNNEKFDVPEGVQDMVSAFYTGRNMDLSNAKVGDIISMPCFVDKEVWNLKIRFVGKEVIETDLGKFRCLKFNPIVQKGRVFSKEEDLSVWISDDLNHIPLRAQANVLVGSIKMDITKTERLANSTSRVY